MWKEFECWVALFHSGPNLLSVCGQVEPILLDSSVNRWSDGRSGFVVRDIKTWNPIHLAHFSSPLLSHFAVRLTSLASSPPPTRSHFLCGSVIGAARPPPSSGLQFTFPFGPLIGGSSSGLFCHLCHHFPSFFLISLHPPYVFTHASADPSPHRLPVRIAS
jgi:hypothetical protein